MNAFDRIYNCGLSVGDTVELYRSYGDNGKYNSNIIKNMPNGTKGIVEEPCNDDWPDDAIQVFMDSGHGAIEDRLLRKITCL